MLRSSAVARSIRVFITCVRLRVGRKGAGSSGLCIGRRGAATLGGGGGGRGWPLVRVMTFRTRPLQRLALTRSAAIELELRINQPRRHHQRRRLLVTGCPSPDDRDTRPRAPTLLSPARQEP